MRYEIFVTLWGEKFVKKFLDFALSSQLTPGNLPGLSKEAYILYRIYTDRASEPFFWPGLERLSPHCDIEFIFYEDIHFKHGTLAEAMKHSVSKSVKHHAQQVTSQHHMALAADKAETAVVLMDSDFIFSDGSLLSAITIDTQPFFALDCKSSTLKFATIIDPNFVSMFFILLGK